MEHNLYPEIHRTIKEHKTCSPKCWFVKDKHNKIVYFPIQLHAVGQEDGPNPLKMLSRMDRKNRNYILVPFPIDDLEAQLDAWYAEKRDYKNESISVIQNIKNKETNNEEQIEKTIPPKYYGILRHAIKQIKTCRLNDPNTIKKNTNYHQNNGDDNDETMLEEENVND